MSDVKVMECRPNKHSCDAIIHKSLAATPTKCSPLEGIIRDKITDHLIKYTKACNFKIYRKGALDSLYISTGNDVIIYFRSAANRTNV